MAGATATALATGACLEGIRGGVLASFVHPAIYNLRSYSIVDWSSVGVGGDWVSVGSIGDWSGMDGSDGWGSVGPVGGGSISSHGWGSVSGTISGVSWSSGGGGSDDGQERHDLKRNLSD